MLFCTSYLVKKMEAFNDIEALKTISNEVNNTHTNIIVATECMKGQAYLVNKLKNKAEQYKETCGYICAANLKVESEIKQAQREITSMSKALDTIKMANVDLRKELILTKEKKKELIENLNNGEKKYEDLWLESKARFESLSFVRNLLNAQNEVQRIEQLIKELENDEKLIYIEMKAKKETCHETDRKRVIELAEFMVVDMPKYINIMKEKSAAIKAITEELGSLDPETNTKTDDNDDLKPEKLCTTFMPKLQLNFFDFDNLNANLDKIGGDDPFTRTPEKTYSVHSIIVIDPSKVTKKKSIDTEEYISSFFYKPQYEANKTPNYAQKKLINILDDIMIDKNEAQRMITYVNPDELRPVDSISVEDLQRVENNNGILDDKGNDKLENEEIEEINMSASGTVQMLIPPTQFLDTPEVQVEDASVKQFSNRMRFNDYYLRLTSADFFLDGLKAIVTSEISGQFRSALQHRNLIYRRLKFFVALSCYGHEAYHQSFGEESMKKQVKFDLPGKMDSITLNDAKQPETEDRIDVNVTINSQLDTSDADDGFQRMKDMIMKKHNIDLSPQFVYTKNVMTPLNIKKSEDAAVTSKFFPQEQNQKAINVIENTVIEKDQTLTTKEVNATPMEIDNEPLILTAPEILSEDVSGPKKQKVSGVSQSEKPISGFMFGQSTQMTCDFIEESSNTTVFEDGDSQPCLDASLLQSPKADLSMPNVETQESLDVPYFLSGLRKTGMSFFGEFPSGSKSNSNSQNQHHKEGKSGFNFNFGGEEKKSRGGLFSMFK